MCIRDSFKRSGLYIPMQEKTEVITQPAGQHIHSNKHSRSETRKARGDFDFHV